MNFAEQQEIELQRRYYAETAYEYNKVHVNENEKDEHFLALSLMVAALDYLEIQSILDVGSGTGRVLNYVKKKRPNIQILGIEPVKELREIGYLNGLSRDELINGDATQIKFDNGQFDLVCEFGVLHHIKKSQTAVSEMLRVANKAIFISDSNNFGQGSPSARFIKQLINAFGLWGFADFIKTKGKGYTILEGDGLTYSYSVFNNYKQIRHHCQSVHLFNTNGAGMNLYRTASHVALLGVK
ncbi:MAG: class I SAM-dependent methyltransferase [Nostoc sp. DedVER02]|uniref:class I SAM-dependent methyltransferase n=1 Tax=unclassified Nostoc TaxID=2593658 RepID=UPI002AD2D168|nr:MULTISPECIES: class I SAM-dependent methyltransferase [unclassified Nostoc]MDZ7987997.1 class I SAM-dependent methyltransferase [Nostoc sp. DedVER02]MDZ8114922.1 class I SAM-dependent methyltransferase [Nostoc sp. DedVER01b]